jgi:hypothetical protein
LDTGTTGTSKPIHTSTNTKQMKGNMQDKTKQKKEKNEVKVRDLKPAKDPKGGTPPGPCGPGRQRSPSRMPTAVE